MRTAQQVRDSLREIPQNILTLTDEEIEAFSREDIHLLQVEFGASVLMELPPKEQRFMEWLKKEDPGIYDDLWEDDEQLLVSLSFLQDFQTGGPGFVICELEHHDNYFLRRSISNRKAPPGWSAFCGKRKKEKISRWKRS